MKIPCRRKQVLLENAFLVPKKKAKDEKFGGLKSFKNQELGKLFTKCGLRNRLKKQDKETRDGIVNRTRSLGS